MHVVCENEKLDWVSTAELLFGEEERDEKERETRGDGKEGFFL